MPTQPATPHSYHRWLRFSLRTFLLVVVLLSIALAWVANTLIRVRHQRALVAEIAAANGSAFYEHEVPLGGNWPLVGNKTPPGPSLIRQAFGDDFFAYVSTVIFEGEPREVPKVARKLKQLPQLHSVNFVRQKVAPESLAAIAQIPSLREVNLHRLHAAPADIRPLQAAKRLEKIAVCGPWVDDAVMRSLGEFTQLQRLSLVEATHSAAGWKLLGKLTNLRVIDTAACPPLGPRELEALGALPHLESLFLFQTPVDSSALFHLSQCRQLKHLAICPSSTISLEAPASFENWHQLESLTLDNLDVKGPLAPLFSHCHDLRTLSLPNCQMTDAAECFLGMGKLTSLTDLDLLNTKLTEQGLTPLQTLTNLRHLRLGPNVTLAEAQQLQRHLPRCEISIDAASGQSLHALPPLQR